MLEKESVLERGRERERLRERERERENLSGSISINHLNGIDTAY